jgi:transcriptional regulator with XRE-family HTH domain
MSKICKIYSSYSRQFAISRLVSAKSPKNLRQIDRLAEWLSLKRKETGWSYPEIARRSGGLVSQGTAANVANKRYDTVDAKTVQGLAKAFQTTEQELWDIVNGVIEIKKSSLETREVTLPASLWRLTDSESHRVKRPWNQFLEAMLIAYFGGDVNIDIDRLQEIRRTTDAFITPLPEGGAGELPFTKENTDNQAKKRSAKQPMPKKMRSG